MTSLIAIGDPHFTSHLEKGGLASYLADHDAMVHRAILRVLDYAAKRSIKHIILLGDICCGPRMSYPAQLALQDIFSRTEFVFHTILGNHDLKSNDPKLGHSLEVIQAQNLPNVRIYTQPKTVRINGSKIRFLPYPHDTFDGEALNICHLDMQGATTDSGRLMDNPDLPKTKHLAISGHIHTNQRVRNTWYTGTLYQTNFGEAQSKYFHHIEYTSPDDYEITNVPFAPEYTLHKIVVSSDADLQRVPTGAKDLVKIVLAKDAHVDINQLKQLNSVKVVPEAVDFLNMGPIEGDALEFSVEEFFEGWLNEQNLEPEFLAQVLALRKQLLQK